MSSVFKREEQMRKELERLDRERRKEEERLLREKQREEERYQREQRREMERREKFLLKETIKVSLTHFHHICHVLAVFNHCIVNSG